MADDDNRDVSDLESIGDDDNDDEYCYGDDGDENVHESDDLASHREKCYTILSEDDIRQLQEEDIAKLSNVLSISRVHSCILLCHYNWNVSKVHDEWFADEESVRKAVGLLEQPSVILNKKELTCSICLEIYLCREMSATACGHQFCHGCWRGFITTSITDGPGSLTLRCPEPSCSAAVGQDMINIFGSDEDKEKYSRYLIRSYIDNNKKTKWCPAPGCEFAVNYDMSSSNYDVRCRCAHSFCWNCTEETHRPVVCETVTKWILKNNSEAENTNWILANSKPCPNCKRPIEKSHGCMHMTCRPPCCFQFCWLCLGEWSKHWGINGVNSCNGFQEMKSGLSEDEQRRQMAEKSIERYTHYYERWAANHLSWEKALADFQSKKTEKLEILSKKLSIPETQLEFITEALEQIVYCRSVLKWTYAYGYYIPKHENAKRKLFEHLQGTAESGLERLHLCAEKELQVFFDEENPLESPLKFNTFRCKLTGLTRVTRDYFDNLVRSLENGLKEVNSSANDNSCDKMKIPGNISYVDYENWHCDWCTYLNPLSTDTCTICEHRR